jgi:hypothetical protein
MNDVGADWKENLIKEGGRSILLRTSKASASMLQILSFKGSLDALKEMGNIFCEGVNAGQHADHPAAYSIS